MPLDGTTVNQVYSVSYDWRRKNSGTTLHDIATDLGIVSVPPYVLLAHKTAELRKHPGSLLYHHRIMVQEILGCAFFIGLFGVCASIFGILVALIIGGMTLMSIMAMIMLGSACLCISTLFVMFIYRVKEPARWVETFPDTLDGIPSQLVDIAMAIKRHHVGAYLVVGKLIQNEILLDPYLIMRTRRGDEIVIGIWDGEEIIASAKCL